MIMKPPSDRPTIIPCLWCGRRTCLPIILFLGIAYAQPANRHVAKRIPTAFTGSPMVLYSPFTRSKPQDVGIRTRSERPRSAAATWDRDYPTGKRADLKPLFPGREQRPNGLWRG